ALPRTVVPSDESVVPVTVNDRDVDLLHGQGHVVGVPKEDDPAGLVEDVGLLVAEDTCSTCGNHSRMPDAGKAQRGSFLEIACLADRVARECRRLASWNEQG